MLLLLVVLVVLLLVSGGVYFLGQQSQLKPVPLSASPAASPVSQVDEMVDWNVYKDDKEGIKFKYPKDWYSSPYSQSTFSVFLNAVPVKIPEATEFITPIHVGYNEVTNTVTNVRSYSESTLVDGIKRYKQLFDPSNISVEENLTVGGRNSAQLSGKLDPNGMLGGEYFKYTLIQMDNKLLVVQLSGDKYKEIYDQILSTFEFVDSDNSQTKLYISEKLGIQFNYKPTYYDSTISVKEVGNKIYVYDTRQNAENGQYLELFTKNPNDSLSEAVNAQFLTGYSKTDCYVVVSPNNDGTSTGVNAYPESYERVTISYPVNTDPNDFPFKNAEKCPPTYTKSNGISYFLGDKQQTLDKYIFVSIGQYAIDAGIDNKLWQATIKFLN